MTEPRQRSNLLLITMAICAIAMAGLLLVVIVIRAGRGTDTTAAAKTTPQRPAVTATTTAPTMAMTMPTDLDHSEVATAIVTVLQNDYGITDVSTVHCPTPMTVRVNAVYTCTLKVDGENEKVSLRITDPSGTYEVGRPS